MGIELLIRCANNFFSAARTADEISCPRARRRDKCVINAYFDSAGIQSETQEFTQKLYSYEEKKAMVLRYLRRFDTSCVPIL